LTVDEICKSGALEFPSSVKKRFLIYLYGIDGGLNRRIRNFEI
jgi:hypothetical protein